MGFDIVVMNEGAVEKEFRTLAKTFVWNSTISNGVPGKLRRLVNSFRQWLFIRSSRNRYDVVYANSAATSHIVKKLGANRHKVVYHIHELPMAIRMFCDLASFRSTVKDAYAVIAVSQAVKKYMLEEFAIPADKLHLVYEFIPLDHFSNTGMETAGSGVFKVGGAGTTDWRKGFDLFVQTIITYYARNKSNPVEFYWVGGKADSLPVQQALYDLKKAGVEKYFHHIAEVENVTGYFRALDVFFLSSREDPFPLVCLEAAALGKPIVCFDQAGGMPEFVGGGNGWIVPFSDVSAVSELLSKLVKERGEVQTKGMAAREAVANYDTAHGSRRIFALINGLCPGDAENRN